MPAAPHRKWGVEIKWEKLGWESGVSVVTQGAFGTSSPGVCKFLCLFLRLELSSYISLLLRSWSRSGGGGAAWLSGMRPAEEEEDEITLLSTQQVKLESVEEDNVIHIWFAEWKVREDVLSLICFYPSRLAKTLLKQWPSRISAGCSCLFFFFFLGCLYICVPFPLTTPFPHRQEVSAVST